MNVLHRGEIRLLEILYRTVNRIDFFIWRTADRSERLSNKIEQRLLDKRGYVYNYTGCNPLTEKERQAFIHDLNRPVFDPDYDWGEGN